MDQPTTDSVPATKDSVPATKDPVPATADSVHDANHDANPPPTEGTVPKGPRFWLVFVCLVLTAFLSALEGSIVSTALPSIARALNASQNYIWVVNVYYLTRYVSCSRFLSFASPAT